MLLSTGPQSWVKQSLKKHTRQLSPLYLQRCLVYRVGSLGMRERRRRGTLHIPPRCCHRFTWYYEVVLWWSQGNTSCLVMWRTCCSLPDLIRPSPLYRTSLYSLFCVSVRSVGPFELDLIALPHASSGGREILDLSLHSPTLGAGGRETLLFSFQICP